MSNQNYQGMSHDRSIFLSLSITEDKKIQFQIALPVKDVNTFKSGFSAQSVLFKKWSIEQYNDYLVILSDKKQKRIVRPHSKKLREDLLASVLFNQNFLKQFSTKPQLYDLGPLQPLLETVHLNTKSHLGEGAEIKGVKLELERMNVETLESKVDIQVHLKKGENVLLESIKADVVHSHRLLGLGLAAQIQQLLLKGLSF